MASLGFENVDHGKNQKAKINHFHKTALFIIDLYYSPLNNDMIQYQYNTNASADCFLFVCLFFVFVVTIVVVVVSYANSKIQDNEIIGPQKGAKK